MATNLGMYTRSHLGLRLLIVCLATSVVGRAHAASCDDDAVLARNRLSASGTLDRLAGSSAKREQAIERAWGDRAAVRGWSASKARDVLVSIFFGKEYKAFDAQQLPLRRTLAELRDFGKAAAASPPIGCDYRVAIDELAHRLNEMEDEQMRWALRTLEAAE